jgi:hypothetical protein
MATSLTAKLLVEFGATYKNLLDLGTAVDPLLTRKAIELGNGTTANNADQLFHDRRTLAASATEDLDLAGGLTNAFGTALTFVELRGIIVTAATANTNNVRVSRPASNGVPLFLAASDGIDIPPGGIFVWCCPADGKVTVTPSTGDLVTVANSAAGTAVTYDVVIIGTSA